MKKLDKGFTLIETIIYIALLGVLLSGALQAVYQIDRSTSGDSTRTTTQDEGDFVSRKIEWALMGTSSLARIMSPMPGTYSDMLSLVNAYGVRIDICRDAGAINMREGSNIALPCSDASYEPLTTNNVQATMLQFYFSQNGLLEASTTLSGTEFDTQALIQ